jgi:hypothetical protein
MISIKNSSSADSRTAKGLVTQEELLNASRQHIGDVQAALAWFAGKLKEAGDSHDYTKIKDIGEFYSDFINLSTEEFKQGKWFGKHLAERHHLNDRCPEDVNLIDVLERIADIVMAGMGRSGNVYDDSLSPEILQKAYANTVKLLQSNVQVAD